MKVARSIGEYRDFRRRCWGSNVGFVPTMGALHRGHITLVDVARKESDVVVASIFVNPKQFGPNEDFSRYPRDLDADLALLQGKADIVFAPAVEDMYPVDPQVTAVVKGMELTSEGRSRPGFFNGVVTVVTKLFNIVQPTVAYFGQKDAHQSIVIRNLIRDFNFPIDLTIVPTVRESDGLAMSSRNRYLKPEERKIAPILSMALLEAQKLIEVEKEKNRDIIVGRALEILKTNPMVTIDYISVCSMEDGTEVHTIPSRSVGTHQPKDSSVLVSGAIKIGSTRLIDNVIAKVEL